MDRLTFGDYTMIGAVGVDREGIQHVLSTREAALRTPRRLSNCWKTS
jgi:hypothetical protein